MDSKGNRALSVKEIILIPWTFREISVAVLILVALSWLENKPADSAKNSGGQVAKIESLYLKYYGQSNQERNSKASRAVASELPSYSRLEK